MFLVQAIYENEDAWRKCAQRIVNELDIRDGGIESLLSGPPLIGMFSIDPKFLDLE